MITEQKPPIILLPTAWLNAFHHHLKASIMSRDNIHWTEQLPLIILGIRNTVKEILGCTPADPVFGTILRLPGEMIVDSPIIGELDPSSFSSRLKSFMRQLQPPDTRQSLPTFPTPQRNCSHALMFFFELILYANLFDPHMMVLSKSSSGAKNIF